MSNSSSSQLLLTQLRQLITAHFDLSEIRLLAYDLGLDYDEIPGETKTPKTQNILEAMLRRGRLNELIDAVAVERPNIMWPRDNIENIPCPYRGLFAFQEEDAHLFFGREKFTNQLLTKVEQQPLVAVIGPSGSGKSSVVFAGLLPKIKNSERWQILQMRPGNDPFQQLASALLPLYIPDLDETDQLIQGRKLTQALKDEDLTLTDVVAHIQNSSQNKPTLLLIIDQFEELYTLTSDQAVRRQFLDNLLVATENNDPTQPFKLLLTLRADFMGHVLGYPPLVDAIQNNDVKLGPMGREDLRRVIEEPAGIELVQFEAGLVERIIEDVGVEENTLPLLQFALTELWKKQHNRMLTHVAYEQIGQVRGALATHADAVYDKFSKTQQEQIERIMVKLVQPGMNQDTRRVARKQEFSHIDWSLVQQLAGPNSRLLITNLDADYEDSAEVIHEALIMRWEKLQNWIDADREFRLWQERLRQNVIQWQALGQDKDSLLRGRQLTEAERWFEERVNDLGIAERKFIIFAMRAQAQKVAEQDAKRKIEEAQRQRELETAQKLAETERERLEEQQKSNQRLRRWSTISFVAALTAVLGVLFSLYQTQIAQARALTGQAQAAFEREDYNLALLLALESRANFNAVRRLGDPTAFANEQLINEIWFVPQDFGQTLFGPIGSALSMAWSNDGQLASGSMDGSVIIWDIPSGQPVHTLTGHSGTVSSVAWSNDGRLASASEDGTIIIWDIASGKPLHTIFHTVSGRFRAVNSVAWSYDGQLASASDNGSIVVWDTASGQRLQTLSGHSGNVFSVAWSYDGRLASGSIDDSIIIWDLASGQPLQTLSGHSGNVRSVAWSNDGQLASGSFDGSVIIWDLTSGQPLQTLSGHSGNVRSVAWSNDGQLASGSFDGSVIIWDLASGQPLQTLSGYLGLVSNVAWSNDGKLASGASDRLGGCLGSAHEPAHSIPIRSY